jgi:D-3-phosphoglycerate dehydrogenase
MAENAERLRLLQLPGVGYDQVDLETLHRRGIPVALSLSGSSECVAEHALMLMLAVSRRLVELDRSLRQGGWLMWGRRTVSHSLYGRTLGLIGLGRIGREVADRAKAFGMMARYNDLVRAEGYPYLALDELLATSDIVSLHVPLTAENYHLLNRARLSAMKKGAILINTARGGLVDEAALYELLCSGHLAGAGLDVFEKEPPDVTQPIFGMDQVVVTPHVATGTLEALEAKAAFYAENIRRVIAGVPPEGLLQTISGPKLPAAGKDVSHPRG